MADENTNVQEIEFDNLEDLLGVGSESIMVPNSSTTVDENKKPGIFSSTTTDTTFLDKPIANDAPVATDATTGEPAATTETPSLEDLNQLIEDFQLVGSRSTGKSN